MEVTEQPLVCVYCLLMSRPEFYQSVQPGSEKSMESSELICGELTRMAENIISDLEAIIPKDPLTCFVFFADATRVYDSWTISQSFLTYEGNCSAQHYDLIGMGYNQVINYFFKKVEVQGFPLQESTADSREFATTILHRFGCASMIRRAVDMVRAGVLKVEKKDKDFIFKKTAAVDLQFLDTIEGDYYSKIRDKITAGIHQNLSGWDILGHKILNEDLFRPGSFFTQEESPFRDLLIERIDELLKPLVRTWKYGSSVLMAYDTTPEIDNHFLAIAHELTKDWREEAGLHPSTSIGGVSAGELTAIIQLIISFYLKHAAFISVATKKYPEINLPMSLTIWTPADDLIRDIAEFTRMEETAVRRIFDVILFKPEEAAMLRNDTSKFIPLLVDMGNGFVLRPFSSIQVNPFFSLIRLLEYRDPNIRHHISEPRENWLRENLYAMFSGMRYQVIEGNIKLKEGGKTITDLDAVIFDNLTGELAIFQIKWQDYFFNDVKKLRSKARNLTHELNEWASKTGKWIADHGRDELIKNLRLTLQHSQVLSGIYLFGISRSKVRMQGYGYSIDSENLAIANWHQFSRNRFEVGPAPRVFQALHQALKEQEKIKVKTRPLPVTWNIGDYNLCFEDLYSALDETPE